MSTTIMVNQMLNFGVKAPKFGTNVEAASFRINIKFPLIWKLTLSGISPVMLILEPFPFLMSICYWLACLKSNFQNIQLIEYTPVNSIFQYNIELEF